MNKHQANIAVSLARRMEKARATQNPSLMVMLVIEHQQLQKYQTRSKPQKLKQWLQTSWNRLTQYMLRQSAPSIEWVETEAGIMIWRGYNPATGETFYSDDQGEIIHWLEIVSSNYNPPTIYGLWGGYSRNLLQTLDDNN